MVSILYSHQEALSRNLLMRHAHETNRIFKTPVKHLYTLSFDILRLNNYSYQVSEGFVIQL